MTRKAASRHMFLSDKYMALARKRKEIQDSMGAEIRKIYPFSDELENISRELRHNASLHTRDRMILEARKRELEDEQKNGRMRLYWEGQEPLVGGNGS